MIYQRRWQLIEFATNIATGTYGVRTAKHGLNLASDWKLLVMCRAHYWLKSIEAFCNGAIYVFLSKFAAYSGKDDDRIRVMRNAISKAFFDWERMHCT